MYHVTLAILLFSASLFSSQLMAQNTSGELSKAHTVSLTNANNGKELTLNHLADKKAIVVVFNSAHCAFCDNYIPRINGLYDTYARQNIAFVAINTNNAEMSPDDSFQAMAEHRPFKFPYVKDEDQHLARHLGASKNPEAFLLIPGEDSFKIAYQGKIDDLPVLTNARAAKATYLIDAIDQVLAGQEVAAPFMEATGCNIKWKRD